MAQTEPRFRFVEVQGEGWTGRRIFALVGAALYWAAFAHHVLLQGSRAGAYDWLFHSVMLIGAGILLPLGITLGRVILRVTRDGMDLRFLVGPLPLFRSRIAKDDIRSAEVVSCYPGIDGGCWGLGKGPRGVRVYRRSVDFTLIVSKQPEAMVAAIRTLLDSSTEPQPAPATTSKALAELDAPL